jgi:hypothetical protein
MAGLIDHRRRFERDQQEWIQRKQDIQEMGKAIERLEEWELFITINPRLSLRENEIADRVKGLLRSMEKSAGVPVRAVFSVSSTDDRRYHCHAVIVGVDDLDISEWRARATSQIGNSKFEIYIPHFGGAEYIARNGLSTNGSIDVYGIERWNTPGRNRGASAQNPSGTKTDIIPASSIPAPAPQTVARRVPHGSGHSGIKQRGKRLRRAVKRQRTEPIRVHVNGRGSYRDQATYAFSAVGSRKRGVKRVGPLTHNQAVYRAFLYAVRRAPIGSTLVVCCDCRVVVKQFDETWQVHSERLDRLLAKIRKVISRRRLTVSVRKIARDKNIAGILLERH